jgi:hypothetical protein
LPDTNVVFTPITVGASLLAKASAQAPLASG